MAAPSEVSLSASHASLCSASIEVVAPSSSADRTRLTKSGTSGKSGAAASRGRGAGPTAWRRARRRRSGPMGDADCASTLHAAAAAAVAAALAGGAEVAAVDSFSASREAGATLCISATRARRSVSEESDSSVWATSAACFGCARSTTSRCEIACS
eukprot:6176820-Pleurochrysis_carterae.AAC.1